MPLITSSQHLSRTHKTSSRPLIHQSFQSGSPPSRAHRVGSSNSMSMSSSQSSSARSSSRSPISMDPDCFVCGMPATARCNCEHEAVRIFAEKAEKKAAAALMDDVRLWATTAARATIQSRFRELESERRAQHSRTISSSPPTASNFSIADRRLKEGTNEDWKRAVKDYPQVLDDWYAELGRRLTNGWGLPQPHRGGSYDDYLSFDGEEEISASRRNRTRRSYDSSDYEDDISERLVDLTVGDRRKDRSKQYHNSNGSSNNGSKYRSHRAPITIRSSDDGRSRRRSDY